MKRVPTFSVFTLLLALFVVPHASAVPFSVDLRFTQGIFGQQTTQFELATSSTGITNYSLPFSGSASNPPGDPIGSGSASGMGQGRATFGAEGLILGSFAALETTVSGSITYVAGINSISTFEDTITVTGGVPGTQGFLRVGLATNGSMSGDGVNPSATLAINSSLLGTGASLLNGSNALTFDMPYAFDTPSLFRLMLFANVGVSSTLLGTTSSETDFFNTLHMTNVQVLEADLQVIASGAVFSNGGFDYSSDLAPVPEPATLFLLSSSLIGLAGVALRKRRRQ